MQATNPARITRTLMFLLLAAFVAGCSLEGDGPKRIMGTPAPPPPEIPPGFCDVINFEDACGPYTFINFEGGVTQIIDNPDPRGLNTTEKVARMWKFSGAVFAGSLLQLPDGIDFADGSAFTMKVWSQRPVPLTFKLEGDGGVGPELIRNHSGSGAWEELCFDFTGQTAGLNVGGMAFIFDINVMGNANSDPANWTFYFDEIEQVASCDGAQPPPPAGEFPTITFDDPAVTYTLTDFGGNASSIVDDPAGGTNQVAQAIKTAGAEIWAGTTVSTLPGLSVPAIPFATGQTQMTVRVYSPDAGTPVRLKVEDAGDVTISVETEATTTVANAWETLTFDFANEVSGTAALNLANTYNRLSIFFDFGTDGTGKTYYFDDIAFGAAPGDGEGVGIIPEAVVYATNPNVTRDLLPPGIDNFGSGAVFNGEFALDPDFNPAFEVASGEGYGAGVHVGFVAFTQYPAGFASGFGTMEFKVKVNAPGSVSEFEVKFFGGGVDDVARIYNLATYSGASVLGNGWYQVQIPMSDFATNIGAMEGFLMGPAGGQAGPFTMLLTDIGFSGTAGDVEPGDGVAIDFDGVGTFSFLNFEGAVSEVVPNPDPSGLNTSSHVAQMKKFAGGEPWAGSSLSLPSAVDFSKGPAFTVLVWSARPVPVTFKLEGLDQQRDAVHPGGGEWQLLCFDFAGATAGPPANGITFIFDILVPGNADSDPDNWTFYFDAIEQVSGCAAQPPGEFATITFDDPAVTYSWADFGGAASVITNDPAGGTNQVLQVLKTAGSEPWAGTTVSTLSGDTVPAIPFAAGQATMTVRVYSPDAGIPVLLKAENALAGSIFVETLATTTVSNAWETLTFDFATPAPGSPLLNLANIYNRISIFFDFGTPGAGKEYFLDDIAFGGEPDDGNGEIGTGIVPEAVVYATDPSVTRDLAPPGIDNFGSGAVFNADFALDPDFNPAFEVASGEGYAAGVHVGFVAFTQYPAGFASGFGTMEFKVKVNAPGSVSEFEVKFFGAGVDDVGRTYNLASYAGAAALGNGWYQVQIPMSDFAANIGAMEGFLMGPAGGQAGPFTMLLTDIGFSGTADDGDNGDTGDCGPVGAELAANGAFETGDLSCWEAITNGGAITVVDTENNTPGGTWSARVAAARLTNPTLKLNFLAEGVAAIGDVVDISFDMKGVAGAGGVIFPKLISEGASGSDGPILETIAVPTADWTTYTYSPVITADVTRGITFEIAVVCGGDEDCVADVFIDNVSIKIAGDTGGEPPPDDGEPVAINFDGAGPFNFNNFDGGVATVIANPDPTGLNTSTQVARMEKFAGQPWGGATLPLPGPVDFSKGTAFTMLVWSARAVPVTFKLEGLNVEEVEDHSGGSEWQLLCFDFTSKTTGAPVNALTFIFQNGVPGDAENDAENWTFYFDDVQQVSGCEASPPPPTGFPTITFDDPAVTYTLTDFGGASSAPTNDPAGGANQVAMVLKPNIADTWAGTTVATLDGLAVPVIPFTASQRQMTVRVYSPDAGIPVMLKVEDAANSAIFVETLATTTVANEWETLTFDFASPRPGTPSLSLENTYNRLSIFFNFGVTGVGDKTYWFDDIAFGGDPENGNGEIGTSIMPEVVVYATDPGVVADLAPPLVDNFGSGATFNSAFASDPDYNPAFQVTSGEGYGANVHVGFVAFLGYPAGFASEFGTLEFKVKVDAPGSTAVFEVKFFGGGDVARTYDLSTYPGSSPLGNGWYQVQIPMGDFAANIEAQEGFLLGPLGNQGGPFTMLLTDIGFSGAAGGGDTGDCGPIGPELAANGDFETGSLACWEAITNGGNISVTNTENNTPGGTWSARVSANPGTNPTLKLNFLAEGVVAIGDVIDISFDMKGVAASGGVIFPKLISEGASGSDGPILETIAVPTAGWTTYSYSPPITADVTRGITFEIAVVCGAVAECVADVFIDNVSVQIR